jgi:hypothetical protein
MYIYIYIHTLCIIFIYIHIVFIYTHKHTYICIYVLHLCMYVFNIYTHRFEDEDVVNLMDGARSSSPNKAHGNSTDSGSWEFVVGEEFVGGEEDQDGSSSEEGPEGKPKNALRMHSQKYSIQWLYPVNI